MAFGVVGEGHPTVQGRVRGFASSVKPELTGLMAAITSAPQDVDAHIRLDNESVVQQFDRLVTPMV
ncbi:hypothetical protein EDD11_001239 [Mortierella claussenii]|nr:hypothetical protein EDD11_001239 [Mortierella claussenii]